MDYQKIYNSLIQKRIEHPLNKDDFEIGTIERHHIVPKSLGGDNSSSNLINLTVREHFIAHRLLLNIYKTDKEKYNKMLFAMFAMMNLYGYNKLSSRKLAFTAGSRFYEKIRLKVQIELAKHNRLRWNNLTMEDKVRRGIKISKSLKRYYESHNSIWCGKKHGEETKKMMSEIAKKRPLTLKCPSLGKKWIHNIFTKENRLVDKDFTNGSDWLDGRKIDTPLRREKDELIEQIKKFNPKVKLTNKMTKSFLEETLEKCKNRFEQNKDLSEHGNTPKRSAVLYDKSFYEMVYPEYKENGFKSVVEKFGYKYSKVNLVNQFKRYIKDYAPNTNGQRNKNK